MCDLETGEIIRTFKSQHEAAQWLVDNGLAKNTNCVSSINGVCQRKPCTTGYGYRKKAYGYDWRYAETEPETSNWTIPPLWERYPSNWTIPLKLNDTPLWERFVRERGAGNTWKSINAAAERAPWRRCLSAFIIKMFWNSWISTFSEHFQAKEKGR